ncbi:hypothetical protein ACOJUR_15620 [Alicyclobacillus tolerans]|uniref:hypothetical protein n=1 Tax=Alicyclobacillus tolerans TaxID=90970 RepID=UPI003B77951E
MYLILNRKNWLTVPVLSIIIALSEVLSMSHLPVSRIDFNEWDILINSFDSPLLVSIIYPILFFSLTVDVLTDEFAENWQCGMIMKYSSRINWILNKIFTTVILVLVYIMIFLFFILTISALFVPWEPGWSKASYALDTLSTGGLSASIFNFPPYVIILKIIILLFVGLFVWSSFVTIIGSFFRKAFVGWLVGASICMISYGIWMTHSNMSMYAPTLQMLLKVHSGFCSKLLHIPHWFNIEWSIGTEISILVISILVYILLFRRHIL